MVRFISAVMITAACIYMGYQSNRTKLFEIQIAEWFLKAVYEMSLSIKNRLTPVFDLVRQEADGKDGAADFFDKILAKSKTENKRFCELWRACVYECYSARINEPELFNAICGIGECLGRYDEESQIKELDMAYEKLKNVSEQLERKYEKGKKVSMSIYTSAGIILSIILL